MIACITTPRAFDAIHYTYNCEVLFCCVCSIAGEFTLAMWASEKQLLLYASGLCNDNHNYLSFLSKRNPLISAIEFITVACIPTTWAGVYVYSAIIRVVAFRNLVAFANKFAFTIMATESQIRLFVSFLNNSHCSILLTKITTGAIS